MLHEFHNANLRSKDFRGQNLMGANFSHANIEGANFNNAILIGANFCNTKAGLSFFRTFILIILSLILSFLAGLIGGYAGALLGDLFGNKYSILGIVCLITLTIFIIVLVREGLGATLAIITEIVAAFVIAALAFLPDKATGLIIDIQFTALALAGTLASIGNIAVAMFISKSMAWSGTVAVNGLIAVFGVVLGAIFGVRSEVSAYLISGFVGLGAISFGTYIGYQALSGNKKYSLIRLLAISILSQGGTSFRGANLTNADFTQASLKSVDFRKAILTLTCWFQSQNLDQARLEGTYLEDAKVRHLVINKDGREKEYNYLNLRELNLRDANLQDASLIGTDLSDATLQNANLSGAKLAQAQLYQANLNEACLTGAYIESWGISTETKLEDIKCEYVYMRLQTKDDADPCRKPDNRKETFKPGDFADFISPIIKTLDLYQTQNIDPRQVAHKFKTLDLFHYEGIDPTAAAIAVTQVANNHPEAELEIIALEGKGKDKIRLQAKVTGDVNRSQLNQEYFQKYAEIQALPYSDIQTLILGIQEKDERIHSLERMLETAIQQPKFYVETYQNQGEFLMSQSKGNINISGTQGNISGVAAAGENLSMTGVAMGAISGSVTNTINQLTESPASDQPGIKELLTELQAAIETDTNLSDEDKKEALEQVQSIAEAGKQPEDGAMQKTVKTAIKILKGTISGLPTAVQLVESCGKILPLITKFFGLP